jgi:hypothetical protein
MGAQAARIGARLHKEISYALKMLALEIVRELKRSTPVDTGHARRNWIASVGDPNELEAIDEQRAQAGILALLSYNLRQGAIWITNVVPYIRQLNAGTSDQQPAAFVELSIDRAITTTRTKLAAKGSPVDFGPMQDQLRTDLVGSAAGNIASAYSPFGD